SRLFEQMLENIKALIINENLTSGTRLPSERELAERFGVSRVPVREALKILEYIGILDGTRGSGFYVRDVQVSDIFNKVNFAFIATAKTITEVMEVRIALESEAAYYAALRRDEQDISAMQESLQAIRCLKKMNSSREEDIENLRQQSNHFHMAIIHAAKNSVLQSVYVSLIDMLQLSRQYTFARSSVSYNTLLAHEAIYEKILSGNAEGARICMAEHLTEAKDVFVRNIADEEKQLTCTKED
ncbi:MAG: FadR family transcriptional regulator, partial [bacterium]|nr:FadR family transcriptional regulator [bacterium]